MDTAPHSPAPRQPPAARSTADEQAVTLFLAASRATRVAADAEQAGRRERARRAYRLSNRLWHRALAAAGVRADWHPAGTGGS